MMKLRRYGDEQIWRVPQILSPELVISKAEKLTTIQSELNRKINKAV